MDCVSTEETLEFGLKLPDGSEVWPPDEYNGFPINTLGDRATVCAKIAKTAQELNHPLEEFLDRYRWVSRRRLVATFSERHGEFSINTPALVGAYDDWPQPEGTVETLDGAAESVSSQESVEAGESGP